MASPDKRSKVETKVSKSSQPGWAGPEMAEGSIFVGFPSAFCVPATLLTLQCGRISLSSLELLLPALLTKLCGVCGNGSADARVASNELGTLLDGPSRLVFDTESGNIEETFKRLGPGIVRKIGDGGGALGGEVREELLGALEKPEQDGSELLG